MTATSRTSGSFPLAVVDEAGVASLVAPPWSAASEETKPADVPEAEPSIWEQNGQAVATTSAPVAAASTMRASAIRVPRVSSNQACAPPAPQHIARSRLRGISTSSTFGREPTSSRGGS